MHKVERSIKGFVTGHSNLFEALSLRYFGPIDGHDLSSLVRIFKDIKDIPGPKLLHCLTVKGKGFAEAEKNQTKWHAPGTFDKLTGKINAPAQTGPKPPKYQDVFGRTLLELAEKNDKIIGITPAMPSGSSLNIMMQAMPRRCYDVGIAEQHAVTLSAGLACEGLIPFCNIYSTFMQRAYDQVIHDVCIQNLAVNFCLDRAGLVGEDGATHHGAYDLAYLRCLPNTILAAPMDEIELRHLLYTAQLNRKALAFFIRYPRGQGQHIEWRKPMKKIPIGTGRQLRKGKDLAFVCIGPLGHVALKVADMLTKKDIQAAVYDFRFVKPIDTRLLKEVLALNVPIITIEDGCTTGGFGSAILEHITTLQNHCPPIKRLGIPDKVIEHGKPDALHTICQYDSTHILKYATDIVQEHSYGHSL